MKLFLILFFLIGALNANSSISKENQIFEKDRLNTVDTTKEEKNQELLRQLKEGRAILSKALVFREGEPFCFIDLQNRENLLPPFAKPAPANFRSSVSFNDEIHACDEEEIKRLSLSTDHFVAEGTQMALLASPALPALGGFLGGLGAGCLIDHLTDLPYYAPIDADFFENPFYLSITPILFSLVGFMASTFSLEIIQSERLAGRVFATSSAVMTGGIGVAIGYMACYLSGNNPITYIVETVSK